MKSTQDKHYISIFSITMCLHPLRQTTVGSILCGIHGGQGQSILCGIHGGQGQNVSEHSTPTIRPTQYLSFSVSLSYTILIHPFVQR